MALCEDNAKEKINERNYSVLADKYEEEQTTILGKRIDDIENSIQTQNQNIKNVYNFVSMIKDYADLVELDAQILNRLISKITIDETAQNENGEKQKETCICYKFVGKLN